MPISTADITAATAVVAVWTAAAIAALVPFTLMPILNALHG